MRRRAFLASLGAVAVAGCTETAGSFTDEPETTPTRAGTDGEPSTEGTADDPYEMDAGTTIVEVTVESEYEGRVTLEAGCRDGGERVVEPGLGEEIERREAGEECHVVLRVGGTVELDRTVADSQSLFVTVTADGSLEQRMEVR